MWISGRAPLSLFAYRGRRIPIYSGRCRTMAHSASETISINGASACAEERPHTYTTYIHTYLADHGRSEYIHRAMLVSYGTRLCQATASAIRNPGTLHRCSAEIDETGAGAARPTTAAGSSVCSACAASRIAEDRLDIAAFYSRSIVLSYYAVRASPHIRYRRPDLLMVSSLLGYVG